MPTKTDAGTRALAMPSWSLDMLKDDRRSSARFFLLTFVFSIPFWLIGNASLGLPINLPTGALVAVCPLVAAMILIRRDDAPGGRTRLLKRLVDRSIRPKIWYVPVLLLGPVMLAATYWIMRLARRPMPKPDIPIMWAIGFFVLFFVGAAAEEAGWSGYMSPIPCSAGGVRWAPA
jgi:uncharacterized protein